MHNIDKPITVITDGVTIISCCRYYEGDNKAIAKGMKHGDSDAICHAADQMAKYIPDNAVLVPMPGRTGLATYTHDLADEISKRTGIPVIDAIQGNARESLYTAKKEGRMLDEHVLGFRQVTPISKDHVPYILDNVVDTGYTAKAAAHAIDGPSVVLAFSISDRLTPQQDSEVHQHPHSLFRR